MPLLVGSRATNATSFAGGLELAITGGPDRGRAVSEEVCWRDVADLALQADGGVMRDAASDEDANLFAFKEWRRCGGTKIERIWGDRWVARAKVEEDVGRKVVAKAGDVAEVKTLVAVAK